MDAYLKRDEIRAIIDPKDMLSLITDALSGCTYLEREGYLHRDISSRNCLVATISEQNKKPKILKLSDFGLAKDIGQERTYKSRDPDTIVLPIAWTPPEAFSGQFSAKSDVWAFGVLMWEVFSFAATPFGHCSLGKHHRCTLRRLTLEEVESKVCKEKMSLLDFPEPCSAAFCPALNNLFSLCWSFDTDSRPNFEQLQTSLNAAAPEIMKVTFPDFSAKPQEPTEITVRVERLLHAAYGGGGAGPVHDTRIGCYSAASSDIEMTDIS